MARDGNGEPDDRAAGQTPAALDRAPARPVYSDPLAGFLSRLPSALNGLQARLLLMTAAFVMLAELLIFVPTLAAFRVNWLDERLQAAQLAAIAADSYPGGAVPSGVRAELLRTAQVKSVASRSGGLRRLVLPVDDDMKIDAHFDMRQSASSVVGHVLNSLAMYGDTLATLGAPNRTIRVLGQIGDDPNDLIEIVLPEAPLRAALVKQTWTIFWVSVLISLLSAALVYLSIYWLIARPIERLSRNMQAFGRNPEDKSRIIAPSGRQDEIGTAETELKAMQQELSSLLAQRARLAELGLAVSKINHDLRNMLSSAQLISDRLTAIPDPTVQRFAPKLIASLDRAIGFCNETLQFGKPSETTPRRELLLLAPVVEEVGDGLGLPREGQIDYVVEFEAGLRVDADPDHLFRIVSNLVRNAVQALEQKAESDGSSEPGRITVKAWRENRRTTIEVRDNGPGIPEKARATLFRAFQGSTRKGGTGLGLAISAELAVAHGGRLRLLDSPTGAAFALELPDRSVS
ncbi:MAG: HAMP domain-containing histidine kinase [Hyphomicrobiaceae bacterium]|nr:HAMP domain-containing histidine kinase [Hyphomicrobiaceae bacterium]